MLISKSKIESHMAEKKLSYKALSNLIDMKANNLSAIVIRGRCTPITAARIADGLKVPVSEIIKEE